MPDAKSAATIAAATSASRIPWRVARMPARCASAVAAAAWRSCEIPAASCVIRSATSASAKIASFVPSSTLAPLRGAIGRPNSAESHAAVSSSFGETVATCSPEMRSQSPSSERGRAPPSRVTGRPTRPRRDRGAARTASAPARRAEGQPRESSGRSDRGSGCRLETDGCWPGSSSPAVGPPAKARSRRPTHATNAPFSSETPSEDSDSATWNRSLHLRSGTRALRLVLEEGESVEKPSAGGPKAAPSHTNQ
jgi:hypothetical protein